MKGIRRKNMAESERAKTAASQRTGKYVSADFCSDRSSLKKCANGEQDFQGSGLHQVADRRYNYGQSHIKHVSGKRIEKKHLPARKIIIVISSILIITFITINISHGKADAVKGMWFYDAVTVYSFNGRGNGELILPTAQYAFTYTLEDDTLHIDFENENVRDAVYTYAIEDESLILTGTGGAVQFHLTRQ